MEQTISGDDGKLIVVVHKAEEGGYWAEVPAIPGFATQGDNAHELEMNLYEVIGVYLSEDVAVEVVPGEKFAKDEWQVIQTRIALRELTRLSEAMGLYDLPTDDSATDADEAPAREAGDRT
jgi:predicted RNase H-like HicB family nuclease